MVFAFIKVDWIKNLGGVFSVRKDMKEGLCYTFAFFLVTPAAILTPLLAEHSFGPEIWKLTANEIAWTAKNLVGGIFIASKGQFKDKVRTIALALVGFGIGFVLLGIAKPFSLYLVVMVAVGLFMPILATAETVGDEITLSPSVAVQPGTAEGAGERTQRLGGRRPLAFDHLQFCQFNGNL